MPKLKKDGQIESLIQDLKSKSDIKEDSNFISLSGNEITNLLLSISKDVRNEQSIDKLLEKTIKLIGESGIAERVLLFQVSDNAKKASLTHYWTSPYTPSVNPIGFQVELQGVPAFKLVDFDGTVQIENISKYLSLPNYIFKNKYKAFLMKLKTKSFLLTTGSTKKVKVAINLQFNSRDVVWSNEIEKLLQSVVDQLAIAIEQFSEKNKKEKLQKNIIKVQEKAIKEREELLRQFAGDVHDLPCSIIPRLKENLKSKDFEECEKLVDELYSNLRQLINEYVVPDMDLLTFGSNIYQFINGFKKSFKGKVSISLPEDEISLSQRQSTELFKVIKEWFCNIEKHANATEVSFEIKEINDLYYIISISDNGVGFDVSDTKNIGYGILNMRRRLSDIEAKYEIKSKKNLGSTIKIQVCPVS